MAASRKPRSITLRQAVDVEVAPVPFVPFQSVRTLDLYRLARGRHEVELGQFEADCCKRTVRAIVRQGYVTEVTVDACSDRKAKVTPEFARLMARARKKLKGSARPRPRLPLPVTRFFARNTQGDIEINLEITSICLRHCIVFFGTQICTICCITFGSGGEQLNCGTIVNPF